MITIKFTCDQCKKDFKQEEVITVHFKTAPSTYRGILLPKNEFHFCSTQCLHFFLEDILS